MRGFDPAVFPVIAAKPPHKILLCGAFGGGNEFWLSAVSLTTISDY